MWYFVQFLPFFVEEINFFWTDFSMESSFFSTLQKKGHNPEVHHNLIDPVFLQKKSLSLSHLVPDTWT